MARRKKPEYETIEESTTRRQLEAIADHANRNEKVSWDRKMDNMVSLLAVINPLEQKILDLNTKKAPLMDQLIALRKDMVYECVHPFDNLVHKGDFIECKFCMTKLSLPKLA